MSKGWESKNVEEQQAAAATSSSEKTQAAERDLEARRADGDRKRRIQTLEMQRERILSERTSSPHRRKTLEIALGEIERLLQELGLALKL
jgi:hypothetical protein